MAATAASPNSEIARVTKPLPIGVATLVSMAGAAMAIIGFKSVLKRDISIIAKPP